MKLYEKPEKSAVCGATHSWPHSPSSLSLSFFFAVFLPSTQTHQRPNPFPPTETRDSVEEKEEEGDGEARRGEARACPKAAISFFHRQGFLEQAASRWTPPGFGNVSIRDSTGRWTGIPKERRDGDREGAGSFCEQALASILSPPLTVHRRRLTDASSNLKLIPPRFRTRHRRYALESASIRASRVSLESVSHLRTCLREPIFEYVASYSYISTQKFPSAVQF